MFRGVSNVSRVTKHSEGANCSGCLQQSSADWVKLIVIMCQVTRPLVIRFLWSAALSVGASATQSFLSSNCHSYLSTNYVDICKIMAFPADRSDVKSYDFCIWLVLRRSRIERQCHHWHKYNNWPISKNNDRWH